MSGPLDRRLKIFVINLAESTTSVRVEETRFLNLEKKSCYDVGYYPQVQLVHQLWPPEDTVCSIDFDIVFFHGVRKPGETEAWKNTWVEHSSAQEFWLKDWLPQDLDGNVRVLALSYDSCAIQSNNEGNLQDVSDLGKNLLQSLVFRFLHTKS